MTEQPYIVETRHAAEECEKAFEDWERLRKNQDLPIVSGQGWCYCPYGDHSGFLLVGSEEAAQEVQRTYTAGTTTYRQIEAFPFTLEEEARA